MASLYIRTIVFLLLGLTPLLWAIDLKQELDPQGALGMRMDYGLATRKSYSNDENKHEFVFSTHLIFKNSVKEISDGQMVQLAYDATKEMGKDLEQYGAKNKAGRPFPPSTPTVVTIMAFGKEVIIASSQKGKLIFIDEVQTSPVSDQLEQCQMMWIDSVTPSKDNILHINYRHCGEIMATHLFYLLHEGKQIGDFPDPQPRMISIVRNHELPLGMQPFDPCGRDKKVSILKAMNSIPDIYLRPMLTKTQDRWGCDYYLKQIHDAIKVLPTTTQPEPYDLTTLAGGNPEIDSISVCSLPHKQD